MHGMKNPKI